MRASVDADGCCTRALARPARPGPSSCHVPLACCAVPALLLICFDLIWSSLCHHQPSPDSRSFLWEVVRGTNHPSPNSKSRAREPPPVGPSGVVCGGAWSRTISHTRTEREMERAGGRERARATGCVPGFTSWLLLIVRRWTRDGHCQIPDHAWHVGQAVDLPLFLTG